jgi:DNA invertase Pin-like site-specific DNA recombinase
MFQMLGVFAEFEREMIRERVMSGMARAKEQPRKGAMAIGRPRVAEGKELQIIALRDQGFGVLKVAREIGCGVSTLRGRPHRLREASM